MFDGARNWAFLFVTFSTGFFSFFRHDLSLTNNHNVFTRKFLFQFTNDLCLDFLPAVDLWSWDHKSKSATATDFHFFDSDKIELHKLFFGGIVSVVLDIKNSL